MAREVGPRSERVMTVARSVSDVLAQHGGFEVECIHLGRELDKGLAHLERLQESRRQREQAVPGEVVAGMAQRPRPGLAQGVS